MLSYRRVHQSLTSTRPTVFTVCSATNALVFWAFYPETKGRTLEEMDDFFNRGRLFIAFDKEATRGRSEGEATEVVKGELPDGAGRSAP